MNDLESNERADERSGLQKLDGSIEHIVYSNEDNGYTICERFICHIWKKYRKRSCDIKDSRARFLLEYPSRADNFR